MPSALVMAFPKWDVKCGSRLLMIFFGRPNQWNTFSEYSFAIPVPVIMVEQGRKITPQEQPWSTMVRIMSCPSLFGSPVMRSITI
jgi:hypothetical protein